MTVVVGIPQNRIKTITSGCYSIEVRFLIYLLKQAGFSNPKYSDTLNINYSFTENESTLEIFIDVLDNQNDTKLYCSKTFNISKEEYKGGVYTLFIMDRYTDCLDIEIVPYATDRKSTLPIAYDGNTLSLVRFYITEDTKDSYIFIYGLDKEITEIDGNKIEEVPLGILGSSTRAIMSKCPELKRKFDYWKLRYELKLKADVSNTITYLEGQIDVLYQIIDKLIKVSNVDVSEYAEILNAVATNSVLTVKSPENIRDDIVKDKSNIRKAQKLYYTALKALQDKEKEEHEEA